MESQDILFISLSPSVEGRHIQMFVQKELVGQFKMKFPNSLRIPRALLKFFETEPKEAPLDLSILRERCVQLGQEVVLKEMGPAGQGLFVLPGQNLSARFLVYTGDYSLGDKKDCSSDKVYALTQGEETFEVFGTEGDLAAKIQHLEWKGRHPPSNREDEAFANLIPQLEYLAVKNADINYYIPINVMCFMPDFQDLVRQAALDSPPFLLGWDYGLEYLRSRQWWVPLRFTVHGDPLPMADQLIRIRIALDGQESFIFSQLGRNLSPLPTGFLFRKEESLILSTGADAHLEDRLVRSGRPVYALTCVEPSVKLRLVETTGGCMLEIGRSGVDLLASPEIRELRRQMTAVGIDFSLFQPAEDPHPRLWFLMSDLLQFSRVQRQAFVDMLWGMGYFTLKTYTDSLQEAGKVAREE